MDDAFLEESYAVLSRTPAALDAQLRGLPSEWLHATEGPNTWSPYVVVAHLLHTERTNWMPRAEWLLRHGLDQVFPPFDREPPVSEDAKPTLESLLDAFKLEREQSLARLRALRLGSSELEKQGLHPSFGAVTLRQLLATWTAHDLGHLVQINRVMARRYESEVGPWTAFLSVMRRAGQ